MQEIEQHKSGKLVLDFSEIRIEQLASANPIVYEGAGTITHIDGHHLKLKMFVERAQPERWSTFHAEIIAIETGGVSGTLFPPNSYFKLTATDLSGRHWICSSLRTRTTFDNNGKEILVQAGLSELTCELPGYAASKTDTIKLHFPLEVDFPSNSLTRVETNVGESREIRSTTLDVAEHEFGDWKFLVTQKEGWTVFELHSPTAKLPALFEVRVCEALSYTFGWDCRPAIIEKHYGGENTFTLRSFAELEVERHAYPPNINSHYDPTDSYWLLFYRYLLKACEATSDDWHPISMQVFPTLRLGKLSLDAQCLIMSVAVEGLIGVAFKTVAPVPTDISAEKKALLDLVTKSTLPEAFKNRVNNWTKGMDGIRPIDKLYHLASQGVFPKEFAENWKNLRDSRAHGKTMSAQEIDLVLRRIHVVRTLLHQLVFLAIDFQGTYTDYASPGWPSKPFNHRMLEDGTGAGIPAP